MLLLSILIVDIILCVLFSILTKISSRLTPKCVKIARPTLFGYIETREELEFYANELFSLIKSGKLKTKIHKIYPLEDVQQAHKVCHPIRLIFTNVQSQFSRTHTV
jgi:NADPH:quinone reductase-like Zn-dependent oxidoreductase